MGTEGLQSGKSNPHQKDESSDCQLINWANKDHFFVFSFIK